MKKRDNKETKYKETENHVISKSDKEKINIMQSAGCDWGLEDFDYFMSK